MLRPADKPFDTEGGLRLLEGNLGRSVIKVSAVAEQHRLVEAPARIFDSQQALKQAFDAGELDGDLVAVVRFQGPRANGMPELHKLTPFLGILQDSGHQVALVTDGRMSGASGKVLAAIQTTPEAAHGGLIGKIRDGDMITINAGNGELSIATEDDIELREANPNNASSHSYGIGRELFQAFRERATSAEEGASFFD